MRLIFALAFMVVAAVSQAANRANDEHSYAQPTLVKIAASDLDLRVDFGSRTLRGHVDHRLAWADPAAAGPVDLVLDTRALTIERVQARQGDGRWQSVDFALASADPIFGSKLTVTLPQRFDTVRLRY